MYGGDFAERLYSGVTPGGGIDIGLLLAVLSWLALLPATADFQATVCPAVGTARIEPAGAAPGSRVTVVATVDSPDTRCRPIVRQEPFLIVTTPGTSQEVALRNDGGRYRAEFDLPAEPWAIQLYVIDNPDPVLTLDPTRFSVENVEPDRPLFVRTPGAFVIVGCALALIVFALVGLPTSPRGRNRLSR